MESILRKIEKKDLFIILEGPNTRKDILKTTDVKFCATY